MFRRSTKKKIVLTLQFPGERCPGNPEFGPEVCIALPRIVPPRSRAQDLLVEFINHLSLIAWLVFSKIYPNKKWIPLINIPVISYGFAGKLPATPTNIARWLLPGMIFNYFVFGFNKRWWQKHNYVLLSVVFDADTAFMGVLIFFALRNAGHNLKWWGTELDHCPLANKEACLT